MMRSASGPATVSTLAEAEAFAAAGVRDLLYAVGIAPNKLARVVELRRRGVDLAIILDSEDQARAVADACRAHGERIPVLIEIDADDHRAGVAPGDARLVAIGRILHDGGAELRGVMTHAGGSYDTPGAEAIAAMAERERAGVVACATALRAAGLPCPVVSVGSTPTATFARDMTGVTEARVGVYVFMDLVMAGLGVCAVDDIAISVLASVIGHQRAKGWILVDAGWMALSRDRGTASQAVDCGYGLVCDVDGRPYPDLVVRSANQEHGIVALREGSRATLPDLPVGSLVRILPNHACATAAQHARYHVLGGDGAAVAQWPRLGGW
jgi:D-serine deaminase-like pyridoxal phosphate-dependent protein